MFGRWDETKGEDNIDFMPTILSRVDMIFIVKDAHNEERDMVCLSGWAGGSRWFHGHESEQEIFPGKCWCSGCKQEAHEMTALVTCRMLERDPESCGLVLFMP